MWKQTGTIVGLSLLVQVLGETTVPDKAPADAPSGQQPRAMIGSHLSATGTEVAPPAGFMGFCVRDLDQCRGDAKGQHISFTPQLWGSLKQVTKSVNNAIWPEDDNRHYGRPEYWTIPTDGYGDCEDYALTKRAQLLAQGLPAAGLRIAVVFTAQGARHAVLVVDTDQGDYVLDNLSDEVRPWKATSYVWLEQQSPKDPMQWVALQNLRLVAEASQKPLMAIP